MNLQDLVDGMNARMARERAETQMTLGKLIAALEAMPPDTMVDGIEGPHSYRGYYSDLAFERCANRVKAADLLAVCRNAMGQVFEGYKGGDFVMGALTPVWISPYGCGSGDRIMSIDADGRITASPEDDV